MALVSDDDVVRYTAVAVLNCGQVVVVPDGRVGVVQSMAPVAIGDTATVKVKGIMSITTAAALTAGDVVGVHIANQTLLAAGAAGTTAAGTLLYTAADASTAQVDLNVFPGTLTQGVGASTAALGTNSANAAVLPAGVGSVYPTTAADDTVGVRVHASDLVKGRTIFIGNGVSNKILKVYAPTGGVINGAAADAAFSSVSGKGVVLVCLSASGNTWFGF